MKISKLALIALLGGALVAFGCSDDSGPTGGTAGGGGEGGMGGGGVPSCEATACLFCPQAALGDFGALLGDLNVPIDFTAVPEGAVVQGGAVMIDICRRPFRVITAPSSYDIWIFRGSFIFCHCAWIESIFHARQSQQG